MTIPINTSHGPREIAEAFSNLCCRALHLACALLTPPVAQLPHDLSVRSGRALSCLDGSKVLLHKGAVGVARARLALGAICCELAQIRQRAAAQAAAALCGVQGLGEAAVHMSTAARHRWMI